MASNWKPVRFVNGEPVIRFRVEAIRCGNYLTADGEPFEVTPAALEHWTDTFKMFKERKIPVPVPSGTHFQVDGEHNRGNIIDLSNDGKSLWATVELIGKDAPRLRPAIRVDLRGTGMDGRRGNKYQWPIRHLLLTPDPRIPGLKGFVPLAADNRTIHVPVLRYEAWLLPLAHPKNNGNSTGPWPSTSLAPATKTAWASPASATAPPCRSTRKPRPPATWPRSRKRGAPRDLKSQIKRALPRQGPHRARRRADGARGQTGGDRGAAHGDGADHRSLQGRGRGRAGDKRWSARPAPKGAAMSNMPQFGASSVAPTCSSPNSPADCRRNEIDGPVPGRQDQQGQQDQPRRPVTATRGTSPSALQREPSATPSTRRSPCCRRTRTGCTASGPACSAQARRPGRTPTSARTGHRRARKEDEAMAQPSSTRRAATAASKSRTADDEHKPPVSPHPLAQCGALKSHVPTSQPQ